MVPAAAAQVSRDSSDNKPRLKLTLWAGIPVGVLNAGSNRAPKSAASPFNSRAHLFLVSTGDASNVLLAAALNIAGLKTGSVTR